jgi:hypothetical protein
MPVEVSYAVWAGNHAEPTSDTSVIVLVDDAVFTSVGCSYGADSDARRLVAVHAGPRQESLTVLKPFDNYVHPSYLPATTLLFLTAYGDIVLSLASYNTCLARSALIQINNHAPPYHQPLTTL